MSFTTRRFVSLVVALALVAAVAAITATRALAKKPEGKDKPAETTTFTIKTNLDGYDAFWGTFKASGAIEDSGDATYHLWDHFVLDISGQHGSMLIETVITHGDAKTAYGTFHIFAADGAYSDLVGVTGTYSERMPNYKPVLVYPEGPYPTWHLYQTFEGSLPEE
jgi:hypothetical protein